MEPNKQCFTNVFRFNFLATNNEAEYKAFVGGLELAITIGIRRLHILMDSLLAVNQIKGDYESKEEQMIKYHMQLHQVFIEQILRKQNLQANTRSKLAASEGAANMSNIVLTKLCAPKRRANCVRLREELDDINHLVPKKF